MNEAAQPEAPKTYDCPHCGNEVSIRAVMCPACQHPLEGFWHSHGQVAMFYRIRAGVEQPEPDYVVELPAEPEPPASGNDPADSDEMPAEGRAGESEGNEGPESGPEDTPESESASPNDAKE